MVNILVHPYRVRPKIFSDACPFTDAERVEWQTLWRGLLAMATENRIIEEESSHK